MCDVDYFFLLEFFYVVDKPDPAVRFWPSANRSSTGTFVF